MNTKISDEQRGRRALVYVRQSTPTQVSQNRESQRRQYGLVQRATELGFHDVAVIDDDLGRSGSGLTERPGFQRMVAEVCTGQVGAVFCIEASRLARNGRDWHYLVDFCGLVGTLIIDPEGVYDPRLANDRLLLGLKGSMSEFELSLFRQRSQEALRAKARRGELQFCLPIGLSWSEDGRIELDPNRRVQQAIRMVFRKFQAFGSLRQVLLWLRQEKITLPAATYGKRNREPVWKLPVYNSVHKIITNPFYTGAYVFGRTEDRTRVVGDRARKTRGHQKPMDRWIVLIHDHHPGYISWQEYERNQQILAENAHMKQRMAPKAARGGRGLLAGLIRCRRCGRMLRTQYTGPNNMVRYTCSGAHLNHGEALCISFGGLRIDEAIARMTVEALSPHSVDAALQAAEQASHQQDEQVRAITLELQQAQYEVTTARRRYENVDSDNRLVAAELEARWNDSLTRVRELENRLTQVSPERTPDPKADRDGLLALADALPQVWDSPAADMRLKQRIVRVLIKEIVADLDEAHGQVVLLVHWQGGRHTEVRVTKNRAGQHRYCSSESVNEVVRRMAGSWPDAQIASTLNRLGLHTGKGNTWTEKRVYSLRHRLNLPDHDPAVDNSRDLFTLSQAARYLGVSEATVRRLIKDGLVAASQAVPCAPYEIARSALDTDPIKRAVRSARRAGASAKERAADRSTLPLPGLEN